MTDPAIRPEALPELPLPPQGPDAPAVDSPVVIPPPPSFGRQLAQLVVIPAVIVLVAVGVALLFGKIAGGKDTLEDHLFNLRQSSGAGHVLFGFQDPRYKDRSLAAYNIATMIPAMKDPQQRARTSRSLVEILEQNVGEQEEELQVYLLTAVGQLGRPDTFDVVRSRLAAARPRVREGAIGVVLAWPDRSVSKAAIPDLVTLLSDSEPMVRQKAAAALGELAEPGDAGVIQALREAMAAAAAGQREVVWNTAVALARLGDEQGSRYVAMILLDRPTLAQLPAAETGPRTDATLSPAVQTQVILATLAATPTMRHALVWDKIKDLAQHDESRVVKSAARQLLDQRSQRNEPKTISQKP